MQFDLAFEGGGAKGAVFVGAVQELEARGHSARRFVGTSAGAITATLMAAGYRAAELDAIVSERLADGTPRFASFLDVPVRFTADELRASVIQTLFDRVDLPLVPARAEERLEQGLLDAMLALAPFRMLFSLFERGGIYAGDRFLAWMVEKLDARQPGLGAASFADFTRATGSDLSLTVSDTTGEEMLVLNARTAPDCPVAWAVRASMSIPFVLQEVIWQRAWGPYRGRDLTGNVLIDGGILSNFPMRLLATNLAEVAAIMGDTDATACPNLGLLIDETLPVDGAGQPDPAASSNVLDGVMRLKPLRRVERIVETLLNAHDRAVVEACMANNEICRLPALGYGAIDFNMSEPRQRALIRAGRTAMAAYFDARGM
jgi:NTE family protein